MTKRQFPQGLSFSLSRATGLAKAKTRASRGLGAPLSRQARQRKLGASLGCCVVMLFPTTLVATAIWRVTGG